MKIGVPKEILEGERRVAAIPETVAKYKKLGCSVVIEKNAGAGALISDESYEQAGAIVEPDTRRLFEEADLILKVKEPVVNIRLNQHEADLIRQGGALITFLHPAAPGNHEMIEKLRSRGITSFTMDGIPRISRAQRMDALTSMSTLTGYKAVLMAASDLPVIMPLVGTAIGPLKPARVLVVGAGVVGLQAIATAKRLGATVTAIDIRAQAREAASSLGATVAGFEVPAEFAENENGYARKLPRDWMTREQEVLFPAVQNADAVILSALVPGEVAPRLITSGMVESMGPGSVIVDVAIDQGGNCELTVPGSRHVAHGVTILGTKNIPGSLPVNASWLYANNLYYFVENLLKSGTPFNLSDEIASGALVTTRGRIVHEGTLGAMAAN
ncbi:MAG: NAD(P) transhydrogenase subunit alpha [Desulfobacterales bacterium]